MRPLVILVACAALGCFSEGLGPSPDGLAAGTWGGEGAGVIVTDTLAHVHVGCTFGGGAAAAVNAPMQLERTGGERE